MTNDTQLRAATRAIGWAFTFAMLAVATACTDSSGPSAPQPNGLTALVTSPPVPGTLSANAAVSGTLGYVSLRPGGVPNGLSATIRIGAQGVPTEAAVVEGGFDPVGLAASAGDTAFVVITRANGAPPVSGYQVISAVRRPTIIRTSPPEGKRDVPLNAIIVIVFSEPVDPATLDSATIQLTRNAAQVAGRVRPNGTGGFRAEFDPDSLLAPNTDYRLTVLNGIKDLSGAPVDSVPLDVTFTSGTAAVARAVSGTVSGLTGSGLVLHLNAIEDLPVGSNGSFTFASRLAEGDAVTVTVSALPSAPNQLCSVSGGDGIISGQDFSGVTVACFVADPQGQVLFSSSGGDPVTHITCSISTTRPSRDSRQVPTRIRRRSGLRITASSHFSGGPPAPHRAFG